ncbi:MAG: TlpA family protein disulfide reductase [Bacillota bacterium]
MREELKTIIAAFLALFVVLSPAVHNMAQKPQITVPETTNTEIQPVEEVSLVGQQAPSLEMEYLNGEKVTLEDFRGKTLVLYIWSTWYPPSPRGIWFINRLHEENEHPDLVVLAANMGFRDHPEVIERFIRRRNFELPVALCTGDAMTQLNIRTSPGSIHHRQTGVSAVPGYRADKRKKIRKNTGGNPVPGTTDNRHLSRLFFCKRASVSS